MQLIVVNDYCYFVIVIKAGSQESQADKTKKKIKKEENVDIVYHMFDIQVSLTDKLLQNYRLQCTWGLPWLR